MSAHGPSRRKGHLVSKTQKDPTRIRQEAGRHGFVLLTPDGEYEGSFQKVNWECTRCSRKFTTAWRTLSVTTKFRCDHCVFHPESEPPKPPSPLAAPSEEPTAPPAPPTTKQPCEECVTARHLGWAQCYCCKHGLKPLPKRVPPRWVLGICNRCLVKPT